MENELTELLEIPNPRRFDLTASYLPEAFRTSLDRRHRRAQFCNTVVQLPPLSIPIS
jgi:hypothetical protein